MVTRCLLALALSACAARPTPVAPTLAPIAAEPDAAPVAEPTPTLADPPASPCPAPGWATPAMLVGAWQDGRSSLNAPSEPPPRYLHLARGTRVRLRHDYRPDGTATRVELTRYHELADSERRDEQRGTWSVDPSGLLELTFRTPSTARTSRDRVWVSVEYGLPTLAWRTLERDEDGVWRGATWYEEFVRDRAGDRTRGHESRIELRFDPPLAETDGSPCEVEVTRALRVWGGIKPATWNDRARRRCRLESGRVSIDETDARMPIHDPRLMIAYEQFSATFERLAPTALSDGAWHPDLPQRRSRPAEPPLSWQELGSLEHCRTPRLRDEQAGPDGS